MVGVTQDDINNVPQLPAPTAERVERKASGRRAVRLKMAKDAPQVSTVRGWDSAPKHAGSDGTDKADPK